ncbi:hypothetical protein Zm00014a_003754 [Zea mays]|uniref:Uncharacterized protein n=1 Tax=Zea mays TaxID=4577 RepID=A0A3L6FXZ0_MAIZE|nr:hypothetical protein Zm00014a_003754 [Zea mays]
MVDIHHQAKTINIAQEDLETSQRSDATSLATAQTEFFSKLAKKVAGILSNPAELSTQRCKQAPAATPHHSRRNARVGVEFDKQELYLRSTKMAMKALKVIGEAEGVTQQAKEDYTEVFSENLPMAHVEALATLFGWTVPEELKMGLSSAVVSAC